MTKVRYLRTRWRCWGRWRWRVGLQRREWWVGARYDFAAYVWVIGLFGVVLVVMCRER